MNSKQNYNTKSRKYILEFLESKSNTTVSVQDILNHLSEKSVSVNHTTVYRYLSKLTSERKVIKLTVDNGQKAVYQLIKRKTDCDDHIHTQCIKCGKLIHLDCDFMNELKQHLSDSHGFKLKCKGSVLYGICEGCQDN